MDGTHEVGEEASVGGGGQQIFIAELTYVVGWRVVPLSGGRFGVRRFCDWQAEDPCDTSTFDEAARLRETAVYAPGSRWTGLAW